MDLLSPSAPDAAIALIDGATGEVLTYGDLRAAEAVAAKSPARALTFLFARNTPATVLALVSEWASGAAVALINPDLPSEAHKDLVTRFGPHRLIGPSDVVEPLGYADGGNVHRLSRTVREGEGPALHPDLFLLLSTSGTTGSAKFVRLSQKNVVSNAADIVTALGITPDDRALAHLPLHYSFGLSILTSHLRAGASLVLSEEGLMGSGLWNACRTHGCTSISGVPAQIDMLRKLSLRRLKVESLKTVCQAGGRADPAALQALHKELSDRGGRLFVMYGQTEAAPRITTLPAHLFADKPGSVGTALASGKLTIVSDDGAELPPGERGQVLYEGPNVMMGYASEPRHLSNGDEMRGKLMTGDLGYLDADGCLYLTGRKARFAKVAGLRLGLDEIERIAGELVRAAAIDGGDKVVVFAETEDGVDLLAAVEKRLYDQTSAPLRSYLVRAIPALPLMSNGKIDYARLQDIATHG